MVVPPAHAQAGDLLMCGIAGMVYADASRHADEALLRRMNDRLRHRGPDDEGYYLDGPAGLAARRLSIIDLSTGHQPIHNEDEQVWTALNGELYNFAELRAELEALGHRFYTKTDTEVLVHLYEQWGLEGVHKLNGMFAFAIWDRRAQRLALVRDRLGVKPLYYAVKPGLLLFASEAKALLEHPEVSRDLDFQAVDEYLTYEYVPSPRSIFRDIRKLPPGHQLVWDKGQLTIERYWDARFSDAEGVPATEAEAVERLRGHLARSVKMRLVSDVPLGVLLSGGIDSSTMAYYAAQAAPGRLNTFSMTFQDPSFDEQAYADEVAQAIGSRHHTFRMSPEAVPGLLDELGGLMDEPLADGSLIPTYALSKWTRRHVTVALGGDGGDELFAGYPTYLAHQVADRMYLRLPRWVRRGVCEPVVSRLPVSFGNFSLDFKAKRFLAGAEQPAGARHAIWMGSFGAQEKQRLLSRGVQSELGAPDGLSIIDDHLAQCDAEDVQSRMQYLDMKLYLQDGVLVKVDRASMGASLEVRAPFLDYRLVEFACGLPPSWKLRGVTGKYLLKQAMRGQLPARILGRNKKGFGMPVAEWLLIRQLQPLVKDLLDPSALRRGGIFEAPYVQQLMVDHRQRRANHSKRLWTLLMFQLWHRRYVERA